jgi:hypothetical protein
MVTFIQAGDIGRRVQAIVMGVLLLGFAAAMLAALDMLLVQSFSAAMIVP